MPPVKIEHVISFSSEDPEHPASNLVSGEISNKKWLCASWSESCWVELQLSRAERVARVVLGGAGAALVEVLAARGAAGGWVALVPRAVLLTPADSRAAPPSARVRSFDRDALAADARDQLWDRLRVVCAQPYNKHCKFGLSFVHVFAPEPPGPQLAHIALELRSSDDDDSFQPGRLFAKHMEEKGSQLCTNTLIRRANAQAFKNISDSSTMLVKSPINRTATKRKASPPPACREEQPSPPRARPADSNPPRRDPLPAGRDPQCTGKDPRPMGTDTRPARAEPRTARSDSWSNAKDRPAAKDQPTVKVQPAASPARTPHPLRGVVLTLSGYQHPARGELRALAERLGARCTPHVTAALTHVVAAFARTPKTRAAPSAAHVDAAWLRACAKASARLPERDYPAGGAPSARSSSPPTPAALCPSPPARSPSPPPPATSAASPPDPYAVSTEEEPGSSSDEEWGGTLPGALAGRAAGGGGDALRRRYLIAFGGRVR